MFKAVKIEKGDCDGNEAHTDKDVILVQDLFTRQVLHLCVKCLTTQLKLRSRGKKDWPLDSNPDKVPDNGQPEGWEKVEA